jgi:hypothetical protein
MIQQNDREQWKQSRTGRFTASKIGKLMKRGRPKDAEWGETALSVIKTAAVERVMGQPVHTFADFAMKRGTLLEHAATHLLNIYWKSGNVFGTTWMPIGDNAGATPDFMLRDGSVGDIKCPSDVSKLFDFAAEVSNGDFAALLKWDDDYAYQIATQAIASDTDTAHLVLFHDGLCKQAITEEEYQTVNGIMQVIGDKLFNLTGQMYDYTFARAAGGPGFAYVARTFTITPDVKQSILDRIKAAEVICEQYLEQYRRAFDAAPTTEEVELTAPGL